MRKMVIKIANWVDVNSPDEDELEEYLDELIKATE